MRVGRVINLQVYSLIDDASSDDLVHELLNSLIDMGIFSLGASWLTDSSKLISFVSTIA